MTHTYSVLGMDCEDCAKKIKSALIKVDGVKSLHIDVSTRTAIVQMDKHIGADVLNEALSGTGYLLQDERMVQSGGISLDQIGIKRFLPLISVFAVIVALTVLAMIYHGKWDVVYAMRMFEAAFFIIFGGFKIFNLRGFVDAYQTYDIIASRSRFYGYVYPLIEVFLGVGYLTGYNLFATNWITIVVMGIGSIGVLKALSKKEQIQCACLGVVFKVPMTNVTLIEDVLMVAMAFAMLALG